MCAFEVFPPNGVRTREARKTLRDHGLKGYTRQKRRFDQEPDGPYYFFFSDISTKTLKYGPADLITPEMRKTLTKLGWTIVHTSAYRWVSVIANQTKKL